MIYGKDTMHYTAHPHQHPPEGNCLLSVCLVTVDFLHWVRTNGKHVQ